MRNWLKIKAPLQSKLLLTALILLALWPLSTFTFIPKWDNIDCYLPYRYFVGYAFHQGEWPLWNPFQHMGYPAYSDMQNGMYNPILWLIHCFGEYNTNSLIVELLLYYTLAIVGAYKLAQLCVQSEKAKLFIAVAYGFSGFMMGTSQIMIFIAGAAFLPHVLFHFLRLLKEGKTIDLLWSGLFIALCVTSASPAYSIVLIYLLGAIFLYHLIQKQLDQSEQKIRRNTLKPFLILPIVLLLLLPYIVSVLEFLPYFGRAEKLPYSNYLLENPFDWHAYLSFFFPLTTLADSNWFGSTDLTMRSAYIGILPLLFTFLSLRYWRDTSVRWLWLGCAVFLILCAGGSTPMYRFFYQLPGFGLFRHPALFRAHAILFAVLLSGIAFDRWDPKNEEKSFRYLLIGTSALFFLVCMFTAIRPHVDDLKDFFSDWNPFHPAKRHYIKTYLFINTLWMLPLLCIALFAFLKNWKVKTIFLLIVVVDVLLYSQFTAGNTIYYPLENKQYVRYFKSLPKQSDQTCATKPYKDLKEGYQPSIEGLWRNTATFHKKLSFEGHNQSQFKTFNAIEQNSGLNLALENPLFYDIDKRIKLKKYTKPESKVLWAWDGKTTPTINPDTLIIRNPHIALNHFAVEVINKSTKEDLLLLNQNFHQGWTASINGKNVAIHRANEAFMGIKIPPNSRNKVQFTFDSPLTKTAFKVAFGAFLLLIIWMLLLFFSKKY